MTPQPETRSLPLALDVGRIREDFPALRQLVHGKPLVYLDSAATSLKPQTVIEAVVCCYTEHCANVHRGVHKLSERATECFENSREKVRRFLNARHAREIIFTRGTTESLNLVARTFGRQRVGRGDEVLITWLEHHSNIVPWQILCDEVGATLRVAPVNDAGELDLAAFEQLLGPRTRLVSVAHVSNALGTVLPVREIVRMCRPRAVPVVADGAQGVMHVPVDVQELDCDFYAFSGHKCYGPTGIGVLYGKEEILREMPPYQGGGDMILRVTFEKTVYQDIPHRFEAGTPDISGAIGLGAAIDYLSGLDRSLVAAHEADVLAYAGEALSQVPGLRIVGTAREKAGVVSFDIEGIHSHDIGTIVDREGIAIRTGHHCAQPLMDRMGVTGTARASFALYNARSDVDALVRALHKAREIFGR
jgi:cysteine desulfurase/selenocysteine lyase